MDQCEGQKNPTKIFVPNTRISCDVRTSAALPDTPAEPCVWPSSFLQETFPTPEQHAPPAAVKQTPAVIDMIRDYAEDTVLPWRCVR